MFIKTMPRSATAAASLGTAAGLGAAAGLGTTSLGTKAIEAASNYYQAGSKADQAARKANLVASKAAHRKLISHDLDLGDTDDENTLASKQRPRFDLTFATAN